MRILLLILATLIWGFGFVATKWTLLFFDPTWTNSLRFVLAAGIVLPVLVWKKRLKLSLPVGVCSLLMLAGLQMQTVGINSTTMTKSSFFTAFYAIFTPVLMKMIYKQKFRLGYWILLLCSLVGVGFLCELSLDGLNLGDGFILGSALLFALHILAIDKWAQEEHPVLFNFQQILYVGIMGLPFSFLSSGVPDLDSLWKWSALVPPGPMAGLIFLSLFSSIGAFSIQVYAQQTTRAHVVSLIFLTESVFGAFFGFWLYQEKLSVIGLVGAGLILLSVALVPLFTRFEKTDLIALGPEAENSGTV